MFGGATFVPYGSYYFPDHLLLLSRLPLYLEEKRTGGLAAIEHYPGSSATRMFPMALHPSLGPLAAS